MPKRTKIYPCSCDMTKHVLLLAKVAGILPVKPSKGANVGNCTFVTSLPWFVYSLCLQILYLAYFCFIHYLRWNCSQDKSYKDTDWYLMTVGYLISDLDSMVTLLFGSVYRKKICKILERLSKLDSSLNEAKKLKTNITRATWIILLYSIVKFFSFFHTSVFLTSFKNSLFLLNCSSLESPIALLIRGLTVIFPAVQIAVVYTLVVLTEDKFKYLADSVSLTIESMYSSDRKKLCSLVTTQEEYNVKDQDRFDKLLEHLTKTHLEIFNIVKEINLCVGPQLLICNCSSLYIMIYYLYRFITFTMENHRARRSKIHYILSFFYRLAKIIGYMVLGQRFYSKSLMPLKTIQNARITNLSLQHQQQLQTLMMQWNGKNAYLSACGIVNFGLWLLAPIAGNIITYLLVALQFEDSSPDDNNVTSIG